MQEAAPYHHTRNFSFFSMDQRNPKAMTAHLARIVVRSANNPRNGPQVKIKIP